MFEQPLREVFGVMLQILVDGPKWSQGRRKETAILVLPGIQDYRVSEGVDMWLNNQGAYLWVAGTRGDPEYTREQIVQIAGGEDSPDIICGGFARHTPAQMEWCVDQIKSNREVRHLIVTTAAYHLPRCVLTLLARLEKEGEKMPISPVPIASPTGDSFSSAGTEDFASELGKILQHQPSGDVASFEQWSRYLEWRVSLESPDNV